MCRKVDDDDLVTVNDIVRRLNLSSREAVRSWRHRFSDFPEPVAKLGGRPVWAWSDIEQWARAADQTRGYRRQRS